MSNYYPFFEIKSPALCEMLGVTDKRTILARLEELGVQIRCRGKNKYILTEDILQALKEQGTVGYTGQSELAKMFYSDKPR